jgi:hypothetical protein
MFAGGRLGPPFIFLQPPAGTVRAKNKSPDTQPLSGAIYSEWPAPFVQLAAHGLGCMVVSELPDARSDSSGRLRPPRVFSSAVMRRRRG